MLGVDRPDFRRASLVSEIYSEGRRPLKVLPPGLSKAKIKGLVLGKSLSA
jgi:hypothetical protein